MFGAAGALAYALVFPILDWILSFGGYFRGGSASEVYCRIFNVPCKTAAATLSYGDKFVIFARVHAKLYLFFMIAYSIAALLSLLSRSMRLRSGKRVLEVLAIGFAFTPACLILLTYLAAVLLTSYALWPAGGIWLAPLIMVYLTLAIGKFLIAMAGVALFAITVVPSGLVVAGDNSLPARTLTKFWLTLIFRGRK